MAKKSSLKTGTKRLLSSAKQREMFWMPRNTQSELRKATARAMKKNKPAAKKAMIQGAKSRERGK